MEKLDALLEQVRLERAARDTGQWSTKLQRLVDSCHVKQQGFVLDPSTRIAACVARGWGKTTGMKARFARRMMTTPNAKCLYVATTRPAAEELMWAPLKDLFAKLEIGAKFAEAKLKVTLARNGAELRLVGADDKKEIEKLRGLPHHEIGIDEAASYNVELLNHLIHRILEPRLGDYNGTLVLYGTPGHVLTDKSPFYQHSRKGSETSRLYELRDLPEFAGWDGWSLHRGTLQDNDKAHDVCGRDPKCKRNHLWEAALAIKKRNGWSDQNPVWRREYLGEWAADDTENVFKYRAYTDDGAEWNSWCDGKYWSGLFVPQHFDPVWRQHSKTNPFGLPEGREWRYVYGCDLGHSDPFALQVLAYSQTCRAVYQVLEFEKRDMYARTIAELLLGPELKHETPTGVLKWTGWPDGMVADNAGLGDALLAELCSVYGLNMEAAEKKNKHDAIELANGDFVDGHVKLMRGSKLESEASSLQWAVDDFGKLKENKGQPNHNTDAFIYARRKAMHAYATDPLPPRPQKGTPEAFALQEKEEESREAERRWDNLLGSAPDEGWFDEGYFDQ